MKHLKWLGIILFFTACSSSYITTAWKAPGISPQKHKKILVLGLINDPDKTIREKMEQHIVGDLIELGYNAVCSCEEFNPKAFENMSEKVALDKLSNSGIDAVLTIVMLNKVKEKNYVPARINNQDRFWGYYSNMYGRVYSPGYYTTDTKYFWESNFYNLDTKELLYSAQSQSFDPQSAATMGHEYGLMIVKNMVKNNVLQKQIEQPLKSF